MATVNFKQRLCTVYHLSEEEYLPFMLKRVLFKRTRILAPLVLPFNPNFLFHEIRLIEKCGQSEDLRMVQFQVDFYHHKFVTQSATMDVLKIRASGMKLVRLANEVFRLTADKDVPELAS